MAEALGSASSRVFAIFDLMELILLSLGGPQPHQMPLQFSDQLNMLLALRHVHSNFRETIDESFRLQRRMVVMTVFRHLSRRSYGREMDFFPLLYVLQKHFAPFKTFDRIDCASVVRKKGGDLIMQATAPPTISEIPTTFAPSDNTLWRAIRLRCFGYCSRTRITLTVHGAAQTTSGSVRRRKHSLYVTGNTTLGELQDVYRLGAEDVLLKQSKWVTSGEVFPFDVDNGSGEG